MSPTKCASHHFGPWLIEPEWFKQAVESVKSGLLRPVAESVAVDEGDGGDGGYAWGVHDGVAVLPIAGMMMKIRSKFGGTSTVDVRHALRKAVADDRVGAIMLHLDSPGGTVAGTDALAQDVAAANKIKPVVAHIEDLGASAAYYVASQARRITASNGSLVGSLGSRMEVIDSSKYFKDKGIIVHDVSSGEFKGAGLDGTEITDRQMEYFQGIINDATGHFKAAVMRGRGFTQERTDALFDGRVHDAENAKQFGLIDDVSTLDAAMAALHQEIKRMNAESFATYAAEHPEAVAGFIEQGKKLAAADTRAAEAERFKSLRDACPGRPDLAADLFIAGKDANDAATIVTALDREAAQRKADAEKQAAALAEKDKEIARLKFEADGTKPVGTKPEEVPASDKYANMSPDDRIDAEWADDANGCKAKFKAFFAYRAFRKGQIK